MEARAAASSRAVTAGAQGLPDWNTEQVAFLDTAKPLANLSSAEGDMASRKARLVHLARELVRAEGMAALNLRKLAERGDTSTQAIYTLFGGKGGLILALYGNWVSDMEKRLAEAAKTASLEELLWQTASIYREHAFSDPQLFLAGAASADIFEMMRASHAFMLLVSFIEAGVKSGRFREVQDPIVTAQSLWAAVHGAVLFEMLVPEPRPDDFRLFGETLRLLLLSLK